MTSSFSWQFQVADFDHVAVVRPSSSVSLVPQELLNVADELFFGVWLAEHHIDSCGSRIGTELFVVGGHQNDRETGGARICTQLARQLQSIHSRHVLIGYQHVGCRYLDLSRRVQTVLGHQDLISVCGQKAAGLDPNHLRVVGNHHHGLFLSLDLRHKCGGRSRQAPALGFLGSLTLGFVLDRSLNGLAFVLFLVKGFFYGQAVGFALSGLTFGFAPGSGLGGLTFGFAPGGGLGGLTFGFAPGSGLGGLTFGFAPGGGLGG
ncbi:MAG TPA: hypothetical protein PKV14_13100, partial [Accumulibacter sp.]|nr:hypothetical protein [Accumulibacter sp.]